MKKFYFLLVVFLYFFACKRIPAPEEKSWHSDLNELGTYSSPRCVDLTGDGILDVVLGAGRNEFEACDSAVVAINGANGEMLWSVSAKDQIVGSAAFLDATDDGIPDVFIGGRHSELIAINGATGAVLWRFEKLSDEFNTLGFIRFNFYNPQVIPDQNGDGKMDLLITNGGNVRAAMYSENQRFPGVLCVFSSTDGKLLAADTMPDGKETYMSPVIHDFEGKAEWTIIIGTGGETLGGHLFRTTLSNLVKGDISNARLLVSELGHGFIAPPVLADINKDGVADIIANGHGGKMYAVDGRTDSLIWRVEVPDTEASNSIAPGYFNDDDIPDFFSYYSKGAWPENIGIIQIMVNGATGRVEFMDSLGCSGFSTPISIDLNDDGFDEALMSINDYRCEALYPEKIRHMLMVFDFHRNIKYPLGDIIPAKNVSSTPWIGDLDGDKNLDLILCLQAKTLKMHRFYGVQVQRISMNRTISKSPSWSGYMGNEGDGVFKKLKNIQTEE